MRLSKKERLWIDGRAPRPYALSDSERNDRLDMRRLNEAIKLRNNGLSYREISDLFRETGLKVSQEAICIRIKKYEERLNDTG